mmetsp:Transcript_2208/g.5893  ORF Transcript_2208/g.5893 Transcript_2208/m.5893 type:complete len:240 (-) Transcript_2208:659-1378(-)
MIVGGGLGLLRIQLVPCGRCFRAAALLVCRRSDRSIRCRSFRSRTLRSLNFLTSSSKPMSISFLLASRAALVTGPSRAIASSSVISVHFSSGLPVSSSAACTSATSCSDTRLMARPRRPARAVLPMRWTYETGFRGSSDWRTRSTDGTSRPRLAMSVATSTRTCCDLNLARAARRRFWERSECSATFSTPTSVRIPETSAARSQVATKTMVERAFPSSASSSFESPPLLRKTFRPPLQA